MKKSTLLVIATALLLPSLAFAHEAAGDGGFMAGLSHPVLGFDHLLAMLSVGILSAQIGGRAIWTVPATFVVVMLIGGIMGMEGVGLFSIELGIAVSVLVLGIFITLNKKLPMFIAMLVVGFFAVFHGYAHGMEMPYLAEPIYYSLGFVAGTAGIHIAGVLIAVIAKKFADGNQLLRYLGAAIAGIGFYLTFI